MAHIVYDTRERRSVDDDIFQNIVNKYSQYPISLVKKQITYGDFVICNGNKIFAVIERKSMHDFQSSMINKRLDEQMDGLLILRAKYGCHIFLLLEGKCMQSQNVQYRGVSFGQLDAKRRSILYKGIPVIYSKDIEYTLEQVVLIAVDSCKRGGCEDTMCDYLTSIPNEHQDEANKLLARIRELMIVTPCDFLGEVPTQILLPKQKSDAQQLLSMWCSMKFITNKSAPTLMRQWTITEFVYNRPDISEILIGDKKFGAKKMEKIYANINADTMVRILCCINGVSKELAVTLAQYKFNEMPDTIQYRGRNIKKIMGRIKELLSFKLS